ncbi:MAG: M28 family peptidase, partial [Chloroflexota bacterium]
MKRSDYKQAIEDYVRTLSELTAKLGRYPEGINRLAFTPAETDAMEWASQLLEGFGYFCEWDSFLNLHAIDPCIGEERILVGTHLDTVLDAGAYDGTVGLITFLISLQLSDDEGRAFAYPVDFVVFRAEESTVFKEALLGSKVATGLFSLGDLMNRTYERSDD